MEILDKIEQAKIKGFLTVRNKIIYPNAIYHLTQRAPGREKLFLEDKDYLRILSLIKETTSFYKWRIFSFVLIPNHLHILLQINDPNLSEGAKKLFERYAKYFNSKYQRKGPVFCKPYRASLCLDDNYLLASSLYIHLNPFKAALVNDPIDYRWSSLKLFIDESFPDTFVEYKFILSILNDDLNKAKGIYRDLLLKSSEFEYKNILEVPDFMRKFKSFISNIMISPNKNNIKEWSLDKEILEFRKKKRTRTPEDLKAKKYLVEQLLSNGYKIVEIASLLEVSRQTVYNLLNFTK